MVSLVLLSLLGVGLLSALISPLFDGSDPEPQDPAGPPPGPIIVENGDTIFAGPGDNTIISDGPVEFVTVSAGSGNDLIDVEAQVGRLNGGDGDDIIRADTFSYTLEVYGGAGNDTIDSSGAAIRARVYGGAGDDTLNLDYTNLGGDEVSFVEGGIGNDLFTVDINLNVISGVPNPAPVLAGGSGDDVFAIDVQLGSVSIEDPSTDSTSALLVGITDFVAGRDKLQLDVDGATVEVVESPDGRSTNVVLTYAATATAPAVQGIIRLAGVTGLTIDDILVQNAAAA